MTELASIRRAAAANLVFDSAELQVIHSGGSSEFLLITFSAVNDLADGENFWGRNFSQQYGIDTLGFVAKRINFFPKRDVINAIERLGSFLTPGRRVMTFGTSMGGYGALKHASRLRAECALAFSPLYSVMAEDIAHFETRRLGMEQTEISGGDAIQVDDLASRNFVFFDPYSSDDNGHAQLIARLSPRVILMPAANTQHFPIALFAKSEPRRQLLDLALKGDAAAIRDLAHKQRRLSPIRVFTLIQRLAHLDPDVARRMLRHYSAQLFSQSSPSSSDVGQAEFNRVGFKFAARLGDIASELEEHGLAVRCAEMAVMLAPTQNAPHECLVRVLLRAGRSAEARAAASRAYEYFPSSQTFLEILTRTESSDERDWKEAE